MKTACRRSARSAYLFPFFSGCTTSEVIPRMPSGKKTDELPIISAFYDFILWLVPKMSKFPREHRFTLGQRMERLLYEILEKLIRAKFTRERRDILANVNVDLKEPQIITRSVSFEFAISSIAERCCLIARDASPCLYPHIRTAAKRLKQVAHGVSRGLHVSYNNLAAKRRQQFARRLLSPLRGYGVLCVCICRLTPAATCFRRFATAEIWVKTRTKLPLSRVFLEVEDA